MEYYNFPGDFSIRNKHAIKLIDELIISKKDSIIGFINDEYENDDNFDNCVLCVAEKKSQSYNLMLLYFDNKHAKDFCKILPFIKNLNKNQSYYALDVLYGLSDEKEISKRKEKILRYCKSSIIR